MSTIGWVCSCGKWVCDEVGNVCGEAVGTVGWDWWSWVLCSYRKRVYDGVGSEREGDGEWVCSYGKWVCDEVDSICGEGGSW